MNNLATKSLILSVDDTDDLCLLCHEKEKQNNKMVVMASVNKDKLFSCSIYGEDNKSRVLFSSCQHTIHAKCFIKMME